MATITTPSSALTKSLKSASRELHTLSDALVNARLVALFGDRKLYGRGLGTFYLVHKQLDAALEQSMDNPRVKQMEPAMRPLFRTAAFEKDLEFYLGPSWREVVVVTPEIKAYQDHLISLAKSQPELLLAHSYTQHLAMLAGGQIIKGMARKGMALPEGQGTACYEYEGKVGNLRKVYMEAFDRLGESLGEDVRQQLIEEHKQAFRFNNAIIRSFRLGYLAPAKAALKLMPRSVWIALLAVGLGVALAARLLVQSS